MNNMISIQDTTKTITQNAAASSILGKRAYSNSEDAFEAAKQLNNFDKESAQNSTNYDDDSNESEDKKLKRLLQNRKSAKKCRQKKKQEFHSMQSDVVNL